MPEGDSLHSLAARLAPVLVGRAVRRFEAQPLPRAVTEDLVGHVVVAVEARGKNLLVRFDDGRILHVHLKMLGRVRVERPRPTAARPFFRRPPPQLALEVEGARIVGSRIPVIRILRSVSAEARAPDLASLGPDLLGSTFDEAEAVLRLRAVGHLPLGEAVMLQRVVAGIGNVYKSELLFLEKLAPTRLVASVSDEALRKLLARARMLMQTNVARGGPRTTRFALTGPRLWVYGRAGRACLVCGETIVRRYQGAPPGRSTYHCPRCQREVDVELGEGAGAEPVPEGAVTGPAIRARSARSTRVK